MKGIASVVPQSPFFISSKKKSEMMKVNTRLLPTTTSISISSTSGFSSYFNWRIPVTTVKTKSIKAIDFRKKKSTNEHISPDLADDEHQDKKARRQHNPDGHGYTPTNPATALNYQLQIEKGMAFDDGGRARLKDPENFERPTVEECNQTLDEMHLFDMSDPLYEVARNIFRQSKEHREQWVLLRQHQAIVIRNWIELNGQKLGVHKC